MAEKILTFKDKINIILKIKGLTIKDLEDQWKKSGTIYKAMKKPKGLGKRLTEEFLLKFNIKASWWKNPIGTDEASVFEKNGTSVGKSTELDGSMSGYQDEIIKLQKEKIERLEEQLQQYKSGSK